ncbi:hypothetical protein ACTXG7_27550 [Mycolicibacterium sp. Dal123E01]|uniref:hypothetical protein n=1 Tax=Mycolicibacterium sp. Dal123E01 TaxID=3457578 RepID=UPI00403EEB52
MGLLEANCSGLEQLAAECRSRGAVLGAPSAAGPMGMGWQPTAAAVSSANVGVARTSLAMADRLHVTAADLTTAAQQYAMTDERSAVGLRALGPEA